MAVVSLVESDAAAPATSALSEPTLVPAGLEHPTPGFTSPGWQRMNRTFPVGVTAPAGPVTVTLSLTDVPGTTFVVLGFDVVEMVTTPLLTSICADPAPLPPRPEVTPTSATRVSTSVVKGGAGGTGGTGFEGTLSTRI